METLDKRNETYGLDIKIAPSLACRNEILTRDALAGSGTGVSVQELINLVCDLLDGEKDHDIADKVGEEMAPRVIAIRNAIKPLWTYADGRLVL